MVSFNDFTKMDLRIAKIISVEDHPNADNLYLLKADIGEKAIELVAGLKNYYSPQELQGKKIVVLINLEPKKIRGVESQGMLLAAQSEQMVSLITPDKELNVGSRIR
jgi:methionyl-tRNA synthetase